MGEIGIGSGGVLVNGGAVPEAEAEEDDVAFLLGGEDVGVCPFIAGGLHVGEAGAEGLEFLGGEGGEEYEADGVLEEGVAVYVKELGHGGGSHGSAPGEEVGFAGDGERLERGGLPCGRGSLEGFFAEGFWGVFVDH